MLFIGNSSNSGLFSTCCKYRLTSSTVTLGRFISWVVFCGVLDFVLDLGFGGDLVFGGDACFFFFFFFVLLFEMTGITCRSVGGVCLFFVFGLGQIVLVGGIVIGRVLAGVVSSCCCCFSKSNNPKRAAQNSVPSKSRSEDKSSIKVPRTVSLVF